jgi:hypothetical protein
MAGRSGGVEWRLGLAGGVGASTRRAGDGSGAAVFGGGVQALTLTMRTTSSRAAMPP